MRWPWDAAATRRALLLALAAWLSFLVATFLHVHNAYWAAMPVWVIAQPARGVLVERAIFRVIGTLVGAAVGFAIMQVPGAPLLPLALLALWIALNAGTTHLLRGVHGYGALLAGMTAAVVVLPSLVSPAGSMAIAWARVECTLIGVVVASLVLAFQTPAAPLAEFYDEVREVSSEAVSFAARVLRYEPVDERPVLRQISELEASARLHSAGSVAGYRRLGDVDLLVVGSLSIMAAAEALRDRNHTLDPTLPERLEAIAEHLRRAWTEPLGAEQRRLPALDGAEARRLDLALGEILAADHTLSTPAGRSYSPGRREVSLAPHREWRLAWRTGALAGLASFTASALAVRLQVPALGLAALGVCIFVMVLGSLPLPQLVAPKLLAGVVTGVLVGLGYRLVLQPAITSPASLLLSVAPFLLLGGFARTHPRSFAFGIDSNMCFLLASQAGMPALHDLPRLLLDGAALALSAGLVAGLFILLPRRPHMQALEAAALVRRDLQRILEAAVPRDPSQWRALASRQILRLSLHLGRAPSLGRRWPRGLLATLNLGEAMLDLRLLGTPLAVQTLLAATLQQRLAPRPTAEALESLATLENRADVRQALQRVANTLNQAADLLTLGAREPLSRHLANPS